MIEFAMIDDKGAMCTRWMVLSRFENPRPNWFQIHIFRIADVIYREYSEEFITAYQQYVLIKLLKQ